MEDRTIRRHWFGAPLALAGMLCLPALADAASIDLLLKAEQFERQGQYNDALDLYEQMLLQDRSSAEVRERFQACLRRVHQVRRHRDVSFRNTILSLPIEQAIKVYSEVLTNLQARYVDRERVNPQRLFQQGVEELSLALLDESFLREHLAGAAPEAVRRFRAQLREGWLAQPVRDQRDAHRWVVEVALAARQAIGLRPTVTVLEFACGACNCLDEYTFYLTPAQLASELTDVEGELVGIGVELQPLDGKLLISAVAPGSPAERAGLKVHDEIVRIGMNLAGQLTAENARDSLRGQAGSTIDLEVRSADDQSLRGYRIVRAPVLVPSLLDVHMIDPLLGVGYVRLIGFTRNTPQDLEEAIIDLKSKGMKGLILDLRGNPGGLFKSAVKIAERFIPEGVLVSTQSQIRSYNRVHESHSGMAALDLPLIVLIDGETASAAEVLAGALKDHQRALLVGQTTFGKGSIQDVLPLASVPSGIRITLAKFFSPRGQPYSGLGVAPHIEVERTSMAFMNDRQLAIAVQEAARLVAMR